MAKKKRTVVTIETRQRTFVRRRGPAAAARCPLCGAAAPLLTIDEVAALTRTTASDIYRRIETGEFHFRETQEGALLICAVSILTS
jgi:hypothetical protein